MVASRWPWRLLFAASIRVATSVGVRCSRLRNSALGRRTSETARFSPGGGTSLRLEFARISGPSACTTARTMRFLRAVGKLTRFEPAGRFRPTTNTRAAQQRLRMHQRCRYGGKPATGGSRNIRDNILRGGCRLWRAGAVMLSEQEKLQRDIHSLTE